MRKTKTPVSYKSQVHFGPKNPRIRLEDSITIFGGRKKCFIDMKNKKHPPKVIEAVSFFGMVSSQGSLS